MDAATPTTGSLSAEESAPLSPKEQERRKRGEDIAFGIQQTAACWATDFIDPIVGQKIQERFQDATHHGSLKETFTGEFVGDSAAFFAFLGVQRFTPGLTNGLKRLTRKLFDPALEKSGREHLQHETERENVTLTPEAYRRKMEEWKEFQADNIAKSAIISTSSIAFNVGTQKAMGNTHKLWVITMAKVAGAAITVAAMLGMRFTLPRTTRSFDEELSNRYFSPLIRKTQKLFGAEVDDKPVERKHAHGLKQQSHTEQVSASRTSDMGSHYGR